MSCFAVVVFIIYKIKANLYFLIRQAEEGKRCVDIRVQEHRLKIYNNPEVH